MTPPSAEDRARDISDQYYTTVDGKLVRMKGMFPMADTSQDRAREIAEQLALKFFRDPDENIQACIERLIASTAAALDAHGLAERRAGAEEMREIIALHQEEFYHAHHRAKVIRALALPGADRE